MACLASKITTFNKVQLLRVGISTYPGRPERVWELFWWKIPTMWTSSSSSMRKLMWRVLEIWKHIDRVWNLGIIVQNVGPVARRWAHGQHSNGFHVIASTVWWGIQKWKCRVCNHMICNKNVGAGEGTEHMEILIKWRDENELPRPSYKIGKNSLVFSDFVKMLVLYGFLIKLSVW